jgi:hypothetical protein
MLSIPMQGRVLDVRLVYSGADALAYLDSLAPDARQRYFVHEMLDFGFMAAYTGMFVSAWRSHPLLVFWPWLPGLLDLVETSAIAWLLRFPQSESREQLAWVMSIATPLKYFFFYTALAWVLRRAFTAWRMRSSTR